MANILNLDYRYYYSCSRDGKLRQNKCTEGKTIAKRTKGDKKSSRKLDVTGIYATTDGQDGRVKVVYLPAHTNHSLSIEKKAKHISLPLSTQTEISAKLQYRTSVDRIMEGKEIITLISLIFYLLH